MSAGIKLLSSLVVSDKGLEKIINFDLRPELFVGEESDLFDFINDHVQKYGAVPAVDTIKVDCGIELETTIEPPEYYLSQVESRYIHQELKKGINAAVDQLKEKNPNKALELVIETAQQLIVKRSRRQIVDFTTDGLKIFKDDYKKKVILGDEYGINLGWPYLDGMTGGLLPGDVVAIIGRPARGKSYLSLYAGLSAWTQKKVPMFVSMEMKPLPIIQRLAALKVGAPITKLKNAELSTEMYKKVVFGLKSLADAERPFWIIDGNMAATVQEIMLLARHLKPDVIFIDGAYLLRSKNPKVKDWEKIKETIEDIKSLVASQLNIPVVCSYQFNRESVKKSQESIGVENIAGGDAVGQVASIVLGLLEEETVESLIKKKIQILKGRGGESGSFEINWIFDQFPYMNFSQRQEKSLDELMFL